MFGREWRSRELLIGGDFAHNETPARAGIPSRRGGLPPKCGEDTWTLQGGCPTESDERSGLAPVIAAVLSAYHVICFFPRSLIELAPKASSRLRKRGPQHLAEIGMRDLDQRVRPLDIAEHCEVDRAILCHDVLHVMTRRGDPRAPREGRHDGRHSCTAHLGGRLEAEEASPFGCRDSTAE